MTQVLSHKDTNKHQKTTMVCYGLMMKISEMEGVETVQLRRSYSDNVQLCWDVKNPLSDDEIRHQIICNPSRVLDASDMAESSSSSREPEHHFHMKWERSKELAFFTILDDTMASSIIKKKSGKGKKGPHEKMYLPRSYTANDVGEWVSILMIDCRRLEPLKFYPLNEGEFVVIGGVGDHHTRFQDDVDFRDGDWTDYDAQAGHPVSLTGIEFKWEAV
jgi:hypothetical protein